MAWVSKRGAIAAVRSVSMAGIVALLSSPLLGQSVPLPSPQEALERAEQMTSEEIVSVSVDDEIRDRLRFDPAWRELHRAIQQDLMLLKWGGGQLERPVWQQYGAKAYPLLAYYARSGDAVRQRYGMAGIRALGRPYTTLWLEQQLQQGGSRADFYTLTEDWRSLLGLESAAATLDWKVEFGLDDAATQERLLAVARAGLRSTEPYSDVDSFNRAFISALLGYEAAYPVQAWPEPYDPNQDANFAPWRQLERLAQPSDAQIAAAIAQYQTLAPQTQDYVLVTQLGQVKAGEISVVGKALLHAIAADADDPDRVWAIAELDRHGDAEASAQLQAILNGDLSQLAPLSRWAAHELPWRDRLTDRGLHAYYLLLGMATRYPQSRYAMGARQYGEMTGRYYFGNEPRSDCALAAVAARTPAERAAGWRDWLNRYPDHPGADDATYHYARSLQDSNQIVAALRLWITLMTTPIGDRDATYLAWSHVRTLLDVGLSTEQLETLRAVNEAQDAPSPMAGLSGDVSANLSGDVSANLSGDVSANLSGDLSGDLSANLSANLSAAEQADYRLEPDQYRQVAPLIYYSLAVHYARAQQYGKALDISSGLDLAAMDTGVLSSYYDKIAWYADDDSHRPAALQRQMQAFLGEQRQRWQTLQSLQAQRTPEADYAIASNWADVGGWRNGYLNLWTEARVYLLPTGDWNDYYCSVYWSCNADLRGPDAVRQSYQAGSRNAIALQLYQQLLAKPDTPAALREKTLYMVASTLLWQWENYPLGETMRIHPPAGVTASPRPPHPRSPLSPALLEQGADPGYYDRLYAWQRALYDATEQDYLTALDQIIATLTADAPDSVYIDDLLFSRYAMSGDRQYLARIVHDYPTGDRAIEAEFLLSHPADLGGE